MMEAGRTRVAHASGKKRRRRRRKLPVWTHGPMAGLVRTAEWVLNRVGIERSEPVLRWMGERFARLPSNRGRVERAVENLGWCFPEKGEAERRELAIESYRHLFGLAAEVVVGPHLLNLENWHEHIELGEYRQVTDSIDRGQPTLLVTGHYGNWELLGHAIALLGYPMHALYRPLDNAALDKWVVETRARVDTAGNKATCGPPRPVAGGEAAPSPVRETTARHPRPRLRRRPGAGRRLLRRVGPTEIRRHRRFSARTCGSAGLVVDAAPLTSGTV